MARSGIALLLLGLGLPNGPAVGAEPPVGSGDIRISQNDYPIRSIGKLTLINRRGAIHVTGWNQDKIRVRTERKIEELEGNDSAKLIQSVKSFFREVGGDIEVSVDYGADLPIEEKLRVRNNPGLKADLVVQVPNQQEVLVWGAEGKVEVENLKKGVDVRMQTGVLSVRKVSGASVRVACVACSANFLNVSSNIEFLGGSGDVTLKLVRARRVYLETTAGGIKAEKVKGDQIYVTQTGKIIGKELAGVIEFRSFDGDVELAATTASVTGGSHHGKVDLSISRWGADDNSVIESYSGSVVLRLPRDVSAQLEALSNSQAPHISLPLLNEVVADSRAEGSMYKRIGTLGKGGKTLRIVSEKGQIDVLPMN